MKKIIALLILAGIIAAFSTNSGLKAKLRRQWERHHFLTLMAHLRETKRQGLPSAILESKVQEGLAKGAPPEQIIRAVAQRKAILMDVTKKGKPLRSGEIQRKVYAAEKAVTREKQVGMRK
jgi:hypothetical protein